MADMIELSALAFRVDTKDLVDAVKKTEDLKVAVDGLNAPLKEVSNTARTAGKSLGQVASGGDSGKKPAEEVDKITRIIEKAGLQLAIMRNQAVKTADGVARFGEGFSKAQSGALALMQQLGATSEQLKTYSNIFKEMNDIMGVNPFDKSASGLSRLRKEVEEMSRVTALQAEGLALTQKELVAYARDINSVTAAMKAEGATAEQIERALQELRNETLSLSSAKAKLLQQSRELEEQSKREAAAILQKEQAERESVATMQRNFNYRIAFINEQREQEERLYRENMRNMSAFYSAQEKEMSQANRQIQQQIDLKEKLALQAKYMGQGLSSSLSNKAASMELSGVPQETISSFVELAGANERAAKASRQMASATQYLTELDQRLDAQLEQTNRNLDHRYTDALVRAKNALQASGVATDVATARLQNYQNKLNQVAAIERKRELNYLARGVGVQMGDVGISLAGGMNPLLVMIQQGDQIRGLIQQVELQGDEMAGVMNNAAAQIASSFKLTGQAIGGFFTGAVMSAGKAVGNFAAQLPILGSIVQKYKSVSDAALDGALFAELRGDSEAAKRLSRIANLFGVMGTAATAAAGAVVSLGAVLGGALVVAAYKAIKEHDELTRSLVLSSGAMNLTTSQAYAYADAISSAGYRTSDTIKIIALMGKSGELTSKSIKDVTVAAIDLQRYGGVAIEDTVKVFESLAKDPVEALSKVASTTGRVSNETLNFVRVLKNQGREFEAVQLATEEYVRVTSQQIEDLKNGLNSFGLFIKDFSKTVGDAFDYLKSKTNNWFMGQSPLEEAKKSYEDMSLALSIMSRIPGFNTESLEKGIRLAAQFISATASQAQMSSANAEKERVQRELAAEADKLRLANASKAVKLVTQLNILNEKYQKAAPSDKQAFKDQANKLVADFAAEQQKDIDAASAAAKRELSERQKEVNRALEVYNDLTNKSLGYTSSFNNQVKDLNFLKAIGEITQKEYNKAILELNKIQPGYIEAINEENKALLEAEKAKRLAIEAGEKLSDLHLESKINMQQLSSAYASEVDSMFMSAAAKERYTKIQKIELDYAAKLLKINQQAVDNYKKGISVEPESIISALQAAFEEKTLALNLIDKEATLSSVKEIIDSVKSGLSDAMYQALTGKGKEAGQTLRKMLEEELLKKPLRVMIETQISQMAGNIFGSSSDKSSMIGSITNLTSTFKDYFSTGSASAIDGGSPFSEAATLFRTGNIAQGAGMAAGAASSYLAYYSVGKAIGKGISGGFDFGDAQKYENISTAVGAKFGGPIGALAAQIHAGITRRLFGRKFEGSSITGSFGSDGFSGQQNVKLKGGILRSDKTIVTQLDNALTGPVSAAFKDLKDQSREMAAALGLGTQGIIEFTKTVELDLTGLSQEDAIKKFTEMLEGIADDLASTTQGLESYRKEGERSSEALNRLYTSLTEVNRLFRLLDRTMMDASLAGADMASKIVEGFGSVESFNEAVQFLFANFYTEEENLRLKTESLTREFNALGLALPSTREQFLAIVNAQDLTTEAGRNTYVSLLKLSGLFTEITPKLDTLAGKFGNLIGSMFDEAMQEIDKQISASRTAAEEARRISQEYFNVAESLREYARGLRSTAGQTASNYRSVLGSAQGGDVEAMQKLSGAADEYLDVIRATSASTEEYNRRVAQVQQEVLQVAALAEISAVSANYQAELLDINTAILEEIKASIESQNVTAELLEEQLTALGAIADLIDSSSKLTIAQSVSNTSQIRTGLIDNAGNVVASIDSTTAQQLAALANQTLSNTAIAQQQVTGIIDGFATSTQGQTFSLNNVIGGKISDQTSEYSGIVSTQTNTLSGLSQDQLNVLDQVENNGVEAVDVADILARATGEGNTVLRSVLARLDSDNSNFGSLIATVRTSSDEIFNILLGIFEELRNPGGNMGPPVPEGFNLELVQAQGLLGVIRDQGNSAIAAAQQSYDDFINSSGYQAAQLEYAMTGDYRAFAEYEAQAALLNVRIDDLIRNLTRDLEAQRDIIRSLGGVPAFASGGMHSGGLRLVGENGPELEVTGPSRIYSASQTASILQSASAADTSDLLEVLIKKVDLLEAAARSTAVSNNKMAKILDRVTPDGVSIQVSTPV